jgi:putative SOS response-associated peptidase YedK
MDGRVQNPIMCGRYALYGPQSRLRDYFDLKECAEWEARYNIPPTTDVLVIRQKPEVGRIGQMVRWGLVPNWAKDPSIGAKMNNARAETVAENPSFRSSFAKHRCLIPANGFYEWQLVSEAGKVRRQPWYIHAPEGEFFAFAGLLERWRGPDGSDLVTTCVITTTPNAVMQPIHERMPVILPSQAWDQWLGEGSGKLEALKGLLVPSVTEGMMAHPVSTAVNRAGVNGAELIQPAAGGGV